MRKRFLLSSHSVVSDSLWPHGLQHVKFLCPSQSPRVSSNSCPLSLWCHSTISSCRPLLLPCLLLLLPSIFISIRVFSNELALHIWWPNTGVSAPASTLPMNIQGWFPLGLTGLNSFLSKGPSRVLQHCSLKASVLWCSAYSMVQLSPTWLLEKP